MSATSRRTMIITTIIHPVDEREGRRKKITQGESYSNKERERERERVGNEKREVPERMTERSQQWARQLELDDREVRCEGN
jgi:hypothetical protein